MLNQLSLKQNIILAGLTVGCFICLAGCQSKQPAVQVDPRPQYAELRLGSDDKTEILLRADIWRGLFTPHGFRAYDYYISYWATLHGAGPEYNNPKLNKNGLSSEQFNHVGTIKLDLEKKRVIIDLQRIVSKLGEPQKTEPSPANGTYPIRDINHEPFITPE